MHRQLNNMLCAAVSSIVLLLAGPAQCPALAATKAADALDQVIAKAVADTLGPAPCASASRRTMALWVFDEDKVPVAAATAKRLHEELLSRLLAARPKCIDVLDGPALGAIITYLDKNGSLEKNGGSLLQTLNETHQNVDLIAFPSLYNQAGKTVLAVSVVERASGKTLALPPSVIVPEKYLRQDPADDATGLDAAIGAAAKYFADTVPDLSEVRPLGVFFEDSGAQPPAGRYLMDHLVSDLAKDVANVLTGKTLRIRGLSIEPAAAADGTIDAQQLEPGKESAAYDLSGRYWIRGSAVDVRWSIRRGDGATFAWRGKIRISEFKDLELRPVNQATTLHPLTKGSFAFQLTSPKGTAPIYRPGDELTLFLRLGEEASVYCFYVDSKGGITTALPNRFAGAQANRFKAKTLYRLPDAARDPFKFVFTSDTAGEELVVCFASTRDVRADLPNELFPDRVAPVPFLTLVQLRDLFAKLNDTKVSEASVTVTVAR
jgi:Domain of unknown function (DUF4384)